MAKEADGLLTLEAVVTGYGKKQVLDGVSLHVAVGEIVAVIGHNGAGKSTLLKAVFGVLPIWTGRVSLGGKALDAPIPRELLQAGVSYVPQGNRVFSDLTVRENLEMVAVPDGARLKEGIDRVVTLFPILKARLRQRAGSLSGGEKQMLALANALVVSPRLMLLDEPSLGLAPALATEALQRIAQISSETGTAVLIVEQKVREVLRMAKRVYVLRNGQVSFSGLTEALKNEAVLREVYL